MEEGSRPVAVADLKIDYNAKDAPVVATEFVCPSISSQGPGYKRVSSLLLENRHIEFANGALRGYTTLDVTQQRGCVARIRTIASEKEPGSPIRTLASFAVEDGRPGAQRG